jgi:hypothetical protein
VLFAPTHIVGITQRPCTMTKCLNTGGIALRVEPTGAKIVRPLLATVRGDNVRLRLGQRWWGEEHPTLRATGQLF